MKKEMERKGAASLINSITRKAGKDLQVQPAEVHIGDRVVIVGVANDRVPTALFDLAFPAAQNGKYHHYTSYSGFKSIVSSGKLRLYNLHKRFKSGEFRTFCKDHGLDGYISTDAEGNEKGAFKDLMDELFYTSFVSAHDSKDKRFWQFFGNDGKGIRLEFDIQPKQSLWFRKIAYQAPNYLPVIKDLFDAFDARGVKFISAGLSRMGALYQRSDYNWQSEVRMFTKRFPGVAFPFEVLKESKKDEDRTAYVEVALNQINPLGFEVKLTGVLPGPNCDRDKVEAYLKEHAVLQGVRVL